MNLFEKEMKQILESHYTLFIFQQLQVKFFLTAKVTLYSFYFSFLLLSNLVLERATIALEAIILVQMRWRLLHKQSYKFIFLMSIRVL